MENREFTERASPDSYLFHEQRFGGTVFAPSTSSDRVAMVQPVHARVKEDGPRRR